MFSLINRRIKRMVLRHQKAKPMVMISDTTLRDGLQTPGVRLSAEQRLQIAKALGEAGVHSIDCGFPAAHPSEVEAIKLVAKHVKGPVLTCLSRTKPEDVDLAAEALAGVSPFKKAVTLFIGTSPLHRDQKLGMSRAQVIKTMVSAIERAGRNFEMISFGPEDASRTEPDFLHEVYREAIDAGAMSIGFTDTVGIMTPTKAVEAIQRIQDSVPNIDDAMLGVHFHNDLGLATANSLACVKAGANMVQGTVNGVGERAGNVAIEEVVAALVLHNDEYRREVGVDPTKLFALSGLVAELTGFRIADNKPVVGRNMFRTEAGIHQNGMIKHTATYMPFPPELIGAKPVEFVLGPNSGRAAVRHALEATGFVVTDEAVRMVLDIIKHGKHDPGDQPEIAQFMDRIRPFMSDHEKALQNGTAEQA